MLKTTDEEGNVLPEFEKVLDIDIKAAAEAILGKHLIKTCCPLSLIMTVISGLQLVAFVFIQIVDNREPSATFPALRLMRS